jgi:hypothetical protein
MRTGFYDTRRAYEITRVAQCKTVVASNECNVIGITGMLDV